MYLCPQNKGKPYASYDGPIPEEYREIVEMFRQAKTNQDASSLLLDDEEYGGCSPELPFSAQGFPCMSTMTGGIATTL